MSDDDTVERPAGEERRNCIDMPATAKSDKALIRFFEKRRAVVLEELYRHLGTQSRMTVFRRLRNVGYQTSFTDNGRYYTLRELPDFDENGLWFHQGIGFSRAGTLKDTLVALVEAAEAGSTQHELKELVRVRVQNSLLSLVNAKRLARHQLPGEYLYLSSTKEHGAQQLAERKRILSMEQPPPADLPAPLVVMILLEVIHAARLTVDPSDVAARVSGRGVEVSKEQVEHTLERFGIAKKGAS